MPFLTTDPYQPLDPLPDGRHWVTERELVYRSERHDCIVRVPERYVTDCASIPRALWPVVGHPLGRYHPAALVHDRIYETHAVTIDGETIEVHRTVADDILEEACRDLGIGRWPRCPIYLGVRVGGWLAWGRAMAARPVRQAMASTVA